MGEKLTEILAQVELKESEQNAALEAMDALLTAYETEQRAAMSTVDQTTALDAQSQRLVGILRQSILNIKALYPTIRIWLDAVCDGHEKQRVEVETVLNELTRRTLTRWTLTDMVNLCQEGLLGYKPVTPAQRDVFERAFADSAPPLYVLKDMYECIPSKSDESPMFAGREETRLMYHCSRMPNMLGTILKDGLQIKGLGGRLGAAIYLSNAMEKSLMYSGNATVGQNAFGIVLVVETVLGRVFDTYKELSACPATHDSVHAIGMSHPNHEAMLTFMDGTKSKLQYGKATHHPRAENRSSFAHDEFAIYSETRVRIRFILVFQVKSYTTLPHYPQLPTHLISAATLATMPQAKKQRHGGGVTKMRAPIRIAPPGAALAAPPIVVELEEEEEEKDKPMDTLFQASQQLNTHLRKLRDRRNRLSMLGESVTELDEMIAGLLDEKKHQVLMSLYS